MSASGGMASIGGQDDVQVNLDKGLQLTVPVIAVFSCGVAFILFSLIGGILRREYIRRKKLDLNEEFRGPFWVWLYFLTRCPCLVAVFGIVLSAGLSFLGIKDSGYTVNIDMDIANYMQADSAMRHMQTALDTAVQSQVDTMSRRLQPWESEENQTGDVTTDRRLQQVMAQQSAWYWSLDFYFAAKEGAETIFTEAALADIKAFEDSVLAFPDFDRYCLKPRGSCWPIESSTGIFFSTLSEAVGSQVVARYDGKGKLQDIIETLKRLAKTGVFWWTDKDFSATNLLSKYTRSRIRGGVPLEGGDLYARLPQDKKTTGIWLKKLHDELLLTANDGRYPNIEISWHEPYHLYYHEVTQTLWHDCYWSIGAFGFVVIFVALQVKSLFLTFASMLGVLLSFTVSYYFYFSVAGYHQMNLINFIALFLVTGIAADDILVMYSTYELSAAVVALGEMATLQPVDRMLWTYYRAGGSMLVTTATTCGSFYSLCLSSLFVVRRFGFFMGTVVALNYVHVMVIFPSLLLVSEIHWPRMKRRCARCCGYGSTEPDDDDAAGPVDSVDPSSPTSPASPAVGPPTGTTGSGGSIFERSTSGDSGALPRESTGGSIGSVYDNNRKLKKHSASHVSKLFKEQRSFDSLDKKQLRWTARFFDGPLFTTVKRARWALIIMTLAVAGVSCWRAMEDLVTQSGLPQIFIRSRNIGRLQELRTEVFSSYSINDLNSAISAFSPISDTVVTVCPSGGPNNVRCSGKGTCDLDRNVCICNSGHFGNDCSQSLRDTAVLSVQTSPVLFTVILEDGGRFAGEPLTREVKILNNGDAEAEWRLSMPTLPWLSVSPSAGTLGPRSIIAGVAVPTTASVQLRADLTGVALGFDKSEILTLTGGESGSSLVVRAQALEAPELLRILVAPGSLDLTSALRPSLLTNPPVRLAPTFNPEQRTYSATLDHRETSLRVLAVFEAPTDEVRMQNKKVNVTQAFGFQVAIGELVEIEPNVPKQLRVEAYDAESDSSSNYQLTLTRRASEPPGPVELQSVVANDGSLKVVFKPPQDDGGKPVTGYIVAVDSAVSSRRLQSDTVACNPVPCWDHEYGFRSGTGCCEYEVFGLANDQAHTVTITAVNEEGKGQLSIPELNKDSWLWPPVVPRSAPATPNITVAPKVVKYHGEADIFIDRSTIVAGGAVPFGGFTCTAAPGGASASSTVGSNIAVKGLDPTQTYTFTCTFANARLSAGGVPDKSPASPETAPVTPSIPSPVAPTYVSAWLLAGTLSVNLAVDDPYADQLICTALPGGATEGMQATRDISGSGTFELKLPGLATNTSHELDCKMQNSARGRSPEQMLSPATPVLQFPRPPRSPELLGAPVPSSGTITVQLRAEVDDEHGAPTGYLCTGVSAGMPVQRGESNSTTVIVAGLTDGISYELACISRRAVLGLDGSFVDSLPNRTAVLVGEVPPAPTLTGGTMGASSAQLEVQGVSFQPPVLKYSCMIEGKPDSVTAVDVPAGSNQQTWTVTVPVTDQRSNIWHTFYCLATNALGDSARSSTWVAAAVTVTTTTVLTTSTSTASTTTSSSSSTSRSTTSSTSRSSSTITKTTSLTATTVTRTATTTTISVTTTSLTTTSTTKTSTTVTSTRTTVTATTTRTQTATTSTKTTSTATTTTRTRTTSTRTTFTQTTTTVIVITETATTATGTTATRTTATATTTSVTATTETTTVTVITAFVYGDFELLSVDTSSIDTAAGRLAIREAIAAIAGVPVESIQIIVTAGSGGRRLHGTELAVTGLVTRLAAKGQPAEERLVSSRRLSDTLRISFTTAVMRGSEGTVQGTIESAGASGLTSAINTALAQNSISVSVAVQTSTVTATTTTQTTVTTTKTQTTLTTTETSTTTRSTITATETTTTVTMTSVTLTSTLTATTSTMTTTSRTVTRSSTTTSTATTATTVTATTTSKTTTITSTATTTTTTLLEPPQAPAITSVEITGDRELTVSVERTGPMAVDRMVCVTVENSRILMFSESSVVVFRGLTAGNNYTFRCQAWNEKGSSPYSKPSGKPVFVATVPSPPRVRAVAVSGDRELTVIVEGASFTGFSPVLQTHCRSVLGTAAEGSSNFSAPVVMTDLSAGVGYTFECTSENLAGRSKPSNILGPAVIAVMPPKAPTLGCIVPKSGELVVEAILFIDEQLRYEQPQRLYCSTTRGLPTWVTLTRGSATQLVTLKEVTNGQEVQVRCGVKGDAGLSEESKLSQAVVPGTPVISTYALVNATTADEASLRHWVAEDLSVNVSKVVADVARSGETFNGCVPGEHSPKARRLQSQGKETYDLQLKVFVSDEEDPSIPGLLRGLNGFVGATSPLVARTGGSVDALQVPYVATADFTNSQLLDFYLTVEGTDRVPSLTPAFDPEITSYTVNISGQKFTVYGQAASAQAFPLQTSDGQVLPSSHELPGLHPLSKTVTIKVMARDMTQTAYEVLVSMPPMTCAAPCNNGTCNELTGKCDCLPDYSGDDCLAYCPGNPRCSGRGVCSTVEGQCQCEESYTGPNCSSRICPECFNGGVCVEGEDNLLSEWKCQCRSTHTGSQCLDLTCPNECSGAGDCDRETGKCKCYSTHEGEDCSIVSMVLVPLQFCVEVTLVWGIQGYDANYRPIYDPDFNFTDLKAQEWMLDICKLARINKLVRPEGVCFMEEWQRHLDSSLTKPGFPFGGKENQTVGDELQDMMRFQEAGSLIKRDIGTDGTNYQGRVQYVRQRFKYNIHRSSTNPSVLETEYNNWLTFVANVNARAGLGLKMDMVSQSWTQLEVELGILNSTLASFALSVGVSLLAVLIFTGNILLSFYTVMTTVLVICALFGFVTSLMGWEFGAVQAIGMTTFVGMSVDYTLHISHAYYKTRAQDRIKKTHDALVHLGPAVVGGAVTTAGASAFLFPCWIYLFHQLGVMLCMNAMVALLFSFFFLAPVLVVAGPTGRWGDVYAFICPSICGQKPSSRSSKSKDDFGSVHSGASSASDRGSRRRSSKRSSEGAAAGVTSPSQVVVDPSAPGAGLRLAEEEAAFSPVMEENPFLQYEDSDTPILLK